MIKMQWQRQLQVLRLAMLAQDEKLFGRSAR
jgi:hypothetical protein